MNIKYIPPSLVKGVMGFINEASSRYSYKPFSKSVRTLCAVHFLVF